MPWNIPVLDSTGKVKDARISESDYDDRIAALGSDLILSTQFDTEAEMDAHEYETPNGRNTWDTSVKASGGGSMRYNILNTSGATSNNDWRISFGQTIGETGAAAAVPDPRPRIAGDGGAGDLGNVVCIQFRQRFSEEILNTQWLLGNTGAGAGGWKQMILNQGDAVGYYRGHSSISEVNSFSDQEIVLQNVANHCIPQAYHADTEGPLGAFQKFATSLDTSGESYTDDSRSFIGNVSDEIIQNALNDGDANPLLAHPTEFGMRIENNTGDCGSGSFGCTYGLNQMRYTDFPVPTSVNLVQYYPNEWMTFQIRVTLGTLNAGYWENSRFEYWVARENQPSVKIIDTIRDLAASDTSGYSKVWLTTFHTDLQVDATRTSPIQSWVDELIVATSIVNDPGIGAPPPETASYGTGMAANTWYYLSSANGFFGDLQASDIAPSDPGGTSSGSWNTGTCFSPWIGASFDTKRFRWVTLCPGGHNNHPGNEVYGLERMNSGNPQWRLLQSPSVYRNDQVTYADGTPAATHSYGMQVYHPTLDKHFLVGMGSVTGQGFAYPNVFAFDAASETWDQTGGTVVGVYDSLGGSPSGSEIIGSAACYDSGNDVIWWHSSNNGNILGRFDPSQSLGSQWTTYFAASVYIQFQLVCNPVDGYLLTIGGGTSGDAQEIQFYDTDNPSDGATAITNLTDATDGDFSDTDMFENSSGVVQMGVGATYHPPTNTFFILDIGGDIWQLTPPGSLNKSTPNGSAWTFERITQSGTAPVGYDSNGWYGKFQWVPLGQMSEGGLFMVPGRTTVDTAVFKAS